MHCTLFTPYVTAERGNSISARRLASGLQGLGINIDIYAFCEQAVTVTGRPDIVHGFHAYLFGQNILPRVPADLPVVLTLTGTDYNADLLQPERASVVRRAIGRADQLIVFHEAAQQQISRLVPEAANKLTVIPPGISLIDNGLPAAIPGIPSSAPVVLIAAGLRQVKNVAAAITAVAKLREQGSQVCLVHAGPELEMVIAEEIRTAMVRYPWFISLGEVPHQAMASLYRRAAVVINTSLSEAIPNSIIEAMAYGRPVVVSDIPGNRAVVRPGETGMIYRTVDELAVCLQSLLVDKTLARRLGQFGQTHVMAKFSTEREINAHYQIYSALLRQRGGTVSLG